MNDYTCICNCGCQNLSGEYVYRNCKTGTCETNSAYLLINCNNGKLDVVMKEIGNLDNIEAQETYGAYDIIAKIELVTSAQLQKFIVQKIRKLSNVRSAMTLHCKS